MQRHTQADPPLQQDLNPAPETTTYLEMLGRSQLRPSAVPRTDLNLRRLSAADYQTGYTLYVEVGADWLWIDRLSWTEEEWREYYGREGIELWIGSAGSDVAGYFELAADGDGNTEIAYFGLRAQFIGRGIGGWLLTRAVECAWDSGARRVWVHTSSRDHAHALGNYQTRGFRVYKTETKLTP
ncbi:MAG: GNAT family N-acetyltransferase, partial [Gammaproteobacteria bacterium]